MLKPEGLVDDQAVRPLTAGAHKTDAGLLLCQHITPEGDCAQNPCGGNVVSALRLLFSLPSAAVFLLHVSAGHHRAAQRDAPLRSQCDGMGDGPCGCDPCAECATAAIGEDLGDAPRFGTVAVPANFASDGTFTIATWFTKDFCSK